MSQRKITFTPGEYYHLYNRGNSKQDIFKAGRDYVRFQSLLYIANGTKSFEFRKVKNSDIFQFEKGEPLVFIGAYCLMPNHFHLLITPAREGGIQMFMQKLTTGYSMYFNKKYERSGGLFEGRFKSQHASSDNYLKYLFSYIHLNPIKLIQYDWKKVGLRNLNASKQYLSDYQYSSLLDYFGGRQESVILQPEKFPPFFLTKKEIDAELLEWLTYHENTEVQETEVRPPQYR